MTEEEIERCPRGALIEVPLAGYPSERIVLNGVVRKMMGHLIAGWGVGATDDIRQQHYPAFFFVDTFMYERVRRLA